MVNMKDAANNFVAKKVHVISELESVSVDVEMQEKTEKAKDGREYKYSFIEVDGVEYRVPDSVLIQLKEVLKKKPKMKTFCVTRVGTKMEDTKYTVVNLD